MSIVINLRWSRLCRVYCSILIFGCTSFRRRGLQQRQAHHRLLTSRGERQFCMQSVLRGHWFCRRCANSVCRCCPDGGWIGLIGAATPHHENRRCQFSGAALLHADRYPSQNFAFSGSSREDADLLLMTSTNVYCSSSRYVDVFADDLPLDVCAIARLARAMVIAGYAGLRVRFIFGQNGLTIISASTVCRCGTLEVAAYSGMGKLWCWSTISARLNTAPLTYWQFSSADRQYFYGPTYSMAAIAVCIANSFIFYQQILSNNLNE